MLEILMSLSVYGIIHTVFGIVALVCSVWSIAKFHLININHITGKVYVVSTAVTAVTALFIFNHGGFNVAHGLAVLTLLASAAGVLLAYFKLFGKFTAYLQLIAMSSTLLFHSLPTATEIMTRFPMDAPIAKNLQDPILQKTFLVLLILWLVLLGWQLLMLKRKNVYIHH